MKHSSKFLSVLMALMMAFSVVMVPARAEENEPEEGSGQGWRKWVEQLEGEPEEAMTVIPGTEPEPTPEPSPEPVVIDEPEYTSGTLTYETEDYTITVTYPAEAKVSADTQLAVREIPFESEEYAGYYEKTLEKLNENATFGNELEPDTRKGIASAVYFDVTLVKDGQEYEPEATVDVNITFNNGGLPQFDGEETKVIHFADAGTAVIEEPDLEVGTSEEGLNEGMPEGDLVNDFVYTQDSFSVIGVFTTDKYIGDIVVSEYAPKLNAEGDTIAADKTVTDSDNDGIYDLELYVMGNSDTSSSQTVEKTNVILVIDRSGSMKDMTYSVFTSSDTYDSNAEYYFKYNNNYYRAYYVNGVWGYYDYSYTFNPLGTGTTIYLGQTRMDATKKAACSLVDKLLSNNKNETGKEDIIEISLISFAGTNKNANDATIVVPYDSTNTINATYLKNQINNINANGATNWQAALQKAKSEADNFKRDEANESVAVIFLTDGMPTFYNGGGTGYEDPISNVQTCWDKAKDDARAIAGNASYTLYNIFAYGNGSDYLKSLTNYAYGRNGSWNDTTDTTYTNKYFFDAKDTSALEAAFETIIHNISNSVGYGGVAVSDGVNLGATNTSATVGGTINPEEFTYTVYDGTKIVYSVKFDHNGNNATFTINGQEYTAACTTVNTPIKNEAGTVVKTITSKVATVTVDGVEYKMSPATLDNAGKIEWELAGLGILDNYKYALSMHVWPNQMSYDIAADMNNGIYPDLETAIAAYGITDEAEIAKIKASIEKEADGSYAVYTNYEQSVRYYETDEQTIDGQTTTTYSDEKTKPLTKPNPIPLTGSTIPMEKKWGSDLAIAELQELVFGKNSTYTGYTVTLKLNRDGKEYTSYTFPKLNDAGQPVDADGNVSTDATKLVWHQDAAISPGRLTTKDPGGKDYKTVKLTGKTLNGVDISGTYYVVSDGHEYTIEEAAGSDLHFEFSTDVYHPMLVDGKLMNVKVVTNDKGEIVDGSDAEVINPEMTSVYATNTLKGGLNIRKVVTIEDQKTEVKDCTDEFTFEVTLTKDGKPYGTPADQYSTTKPAEYDEEGHGGWSYDQNHDFYYKSGFSAFNIYSGKDADGNRTRLDRSWIPADGKLTLTMPANGEIRVVNLPSGTEYTVKEVVGESGEYQYFKTVSSIKVGENDAGEDLIEVDTEPVTTTDNTVTGTIRGNKANLETYYNWAANFYVYHSSDNTIEKISFSDSRVKGKYDAETKKYTYDFNLVNETKEGYLYGGYYKAYGGQVMQDDEIIKATYSETTADIKMEYVAVRKDGLWAKDSDTSVKYDGSKFNAWKAANAYTADKGTAMHPASSKVYYLKEVPDSYLRPYIEIVYDSYHVENGEKDYPIVQLHLITVVDDGNYREAGIYYDGSAYKNSGKLSSTLKITLADGTTEKLTAKNVFNGKKYPDNKPISVPRGYLSAINMTKEFAGFEEGKKFSMTPYFVTLDGVDVNGKPDGVKVHGIVDRIVDVGNKKYVAGENKTGIAPGIYSTDTVADTYEKRSGRVK